MSSSTKTFSNKKLTIEVKQKFEGTETTKYSHNVSLDSLKPQEKTEEPKFEETVTLNDSFNLSWSDFWYLVKLEKSYRDENPFAKPEEVEHFLNNELNELIFNNQSFFVPMDSGSESYEIFCITLTSQEFLLFASFPVQAVQLTMQVEMLFQRGTSYLLTPTRITVTQMHFVMVTGMRLWKKELVKI